MEELQDAIEDAQYVNAMTDEGPKPSKEWDMPSPEDVVNYKKDQVTKDPNAYNIEVLLQQSLCLYFFSRYCKEECTDNQNPSTRIMFIEETARYKGMYGDEARGAQAASIVTNFLTAASHPVPVELTESNLERKLPKKVSASDIPGFVSSTVGKGDNVLTLGGSLVDDVKKAIEDKRFASTLFDKLDCCVLDLLKQDPWPKFIESPNYEKMIKFLFMMTKPVDEDDFALFRVLGRGGFGLVNGCKKCTSGKLYAMKVMNKKRVKIKRSEQLTLNERVALAAVESPFVVNLKYAFVSDTDVFLILDLMTGGDLSFHLAQKKRFSKPEAQYYSARIMLGCQALHDKKYVYRDLKPENILMGDDGKVKITDLGLACKITPTLHGAAGTRGYWAPEMLRRDKKGKKMPYGHCVDWWSFGCMLAEFISGVCPFRSEAAFKYGTSKGKKEKEKAIDCATLEMEPEWDPKLFDENAADICRQLTKKNEKERLGYRGCEEIMKHPWYKEVNWELIKSDRQEPPYIPPKDVNAASQSEIGQFSEDKNYKKTQLEEKDHMVYKDWNWTNPKSFNTEVIEFLMYEKQLGRPLTPPRSSSGVCCSVS